jgi:hypothetical protein
MLTEMKTFYSGAYGKTHTDEDVDRILKHLPPSTPPVFPGGWWCLCRRLENDITGEFQEHLYQGEKNRGE